MSEMGYRRRIQELIPIFNATPEIQTFLRAMSHSQIPIPQQLRFLLNQTDEEILRRAITIAGLLRLKEVIPELIRIYETADNADLKYEALKQLGAIDDEGLHHYLLKILQNSSDMQSRILAAYGLQTGQWPDAVAPLLAIAQDTTQEAHLRGQVIEAIAYQGNKDTVPSLLQFLKDPEPVVRWDALYAVGQLGDDSFASFIEPLLKDHSPIESAASASIAQDAHDLLQRWSPGTLIEEE